MDTFILQQVLNGLSTGMTYVVLALGLTLVFGVLHVMNFAHGDLYMVGALIAFIAAAQHQLPYGWAVLLAIGCSGLLAIVIDRLAVRPLVARKQGSADTLLSTYALSLLVSEAVLAVWGPTPQAVPGLVGSVDFIGITLTYQRTLVLVAGLLMVAGVHMVLRHTLFGKQIRALAEDRFAAAVVGIPVRRIGSQTFVLAGVLAGAAGALMVPVLTFSPVMGHNVLTKIFAVVVIGGMGSVRGTLVCGLALGVLETFGSMYFSATVNLALVYVLLLLVLLFKPAGLFGKKG
ncbi:branched-chain amino acid ABC transporter permease [Ramlibacter sp. WS9]|uniref:branched-chain amino acid ABC transporter permease n=1 Tax=Ramlibacter sp. WS9 TaxID=1882741 RepID=UPI0013053FE5|nr:branched-chain amino acid ABC transporter permease [Ramlibacter sp. WS9]